MTFTLIVETSSTTTRGFSGIAARVAGGRSLGAKPEKLLLPADALAKMQELIDSKPEPGARLRVAERRRRR